MGDAELGDVVPMVAEGMGLKSDLPPPPTGTFLLVCGWSGAGGSGTASGAHGDQVYTENSQRFSVAAGADLEMFLKLFT